ncbi:MAG: acetylglutamate kinase [Myxococcota bacterium]
MIIVIKMGGELMTVERAQERADIIASMRALLDAQHRLIVVHGGGPQSTMLQRALGQVPTMVGGRRVTDAAALEVTKMAVGGQVNIDLVSALTARSVPAVGLNGVSGHLLACERRPPTLVAGGGDGPVDYGLVGRVTAVHRTLVHVLLDAGYVPVIACLGSDGRGQTYNVNADEVASAVAVAVEADAMAMLTSTPGVLKDKDDPSTRLARLTTAEGRAAIANGTVQGGMIPKVEEAVTTVEAGVGCVLILGRLASGQLESALTEPGRWGTAILRQ